MEKELMKNLTNSVDVNMTEVVKKCSDLYGEDNSLDLQSKLENEYIRSLQDLQYKCKMECWSELSLHELVYTTLVMNKRLFSTRSINLSLNVKQWWKADYRRMAYTNITKQIMFMDHSVVQIKDKLIVNRLISLQLAKLYSELNSLTNIQHYKYTKSRLQMMHANINDILPTNRCFYIRPIDEFPTPHSYEIGQQIVENLIECYYYRSCQWLRSVAINVWASSDIRTGGDDIAIIMNLIGVKPIWQSNSSKVIGFEIIPLTQLKRPRVSVLIRISGLFRDLYPSTISRLSKILESVEIISDESNNSLKWFGTLFCSQLGTYGVGIKSLLNHEDVPDISTIAARYIAYNKYCFNGKTWIAVPSQLFRTLEKIQVIIQTQDNYNYNILDNDDYYQLEGGLNAAIRYCRGGVCAYHIDTSKAMQGPIVIRRLKQELIRASTCKLLNKDWLLNTLNRHCRGIIRVFGILNNFYNFAITTGQSTKSLFNALFLLFNDKDFVQAITRSNLNSYLITKQRLSEIAHDEV